MWCLIVVTFLLKPTPSFSSHISLNPVGGSSSLLSKTNCYAVECFYFGILILFKLKISFSIIFFPFSHSLSLSLVLFLWLNQQSTSLLSASGSAALEFGLNSWVHSICRWNGPGFALLVPFLGSREWGVVNVANVKFSWPAPVSAAC